MAMEILYSEDFLLHEPPYPHPENPNRLRVALRSVRGLGEVVEPPPASIADVLRVHSEGYVKSIVEAVERAPVMIDDDTYVSKDTLRAALRAVGASIYSSNRLAGGPSVILALVRPPGHHSGRGGAAMRASTLGFCIFNNAAIAVSRLLELGLKRVAVLDFDAHHGNGTQEIFYEEPRVLHIDLHEDPAILYPGTGFPTDLGRGEGEGTKINIVFPPGVSDDVYTYALDRIVKPILSEFRPQALVYSAGFDGYEDDGLAHLRLREASFAALGALSAELGIDRVLAILEGGYGPGLEGGLRAFAEALAGRASYEARETNSKLRSLSIEFLEEAARLFSRYWSL